MIITLPHYSLIKISGANAKTFLQGQLTCNMDEVNATDLHLSAYCNPQGRMWSIMRVFQWDDDYYFHLPTEVAEQTLTDLNKYALFSKVSLASQLNYGSMAYIGNTLPELPADFKILRVDHERYLIIATQESLKPFHKDALPTWDLVEIRARIPTVWKETTEKLLPHDVNLPDLNAISFTKGCYKGQEIIARMQYRGQRKKQMYYFRLATEVCPLPGTVITDDAGKTVGEVVSAALGVDRCELLGILPLAGVEGGMKFFCDSLELIPISL